MQKCLVIQPLLFSPISWEHILDDLVQRSTVISIGLILRELTKRLECRYYKPFIIAVYYYYHIHHSVAK